MSRQLAALLALSATLGTGCVSNPDKDTLAGLRDIRADTDDVEIDDSLERAMHSYRRYLNETPDSAMTPEAMRRLADLQIEQQFGITGDGSIMELPAPEPMRIEAPFDGNRSADRSSAGLADFSESDESFESRVTSSLEFSLAEAQLPGLPADVPNPAVSGPTEAIRIYAEILRNYPSYERADQVLYQMARAYDEVGQSDEAMAVMERIVAEYGYSDYLDEVHFRRGEYLFTRRQFRDAEGAYESIIEMGAASSYYELALYKLGWALYKQEFYELALHRFMALLDYKSSIGYDFDAENSQDDERRVADTYRVISLSFSNLGGPEVVNEYFAANGNRNYEDRVYSNLGEFYLTKLRYNDAATVYNSFVELNPYHRIAPRFSMRIVDIYEEGGFPLLVVESKKDFATKYGLQGAYWQYFDSADSPEVLGFLKANLTDLANHYHALYQDESLADEQPANFTEASLWYREFLTSFPADPESPFVNYQLADLLLENGDFGSSASEYERTAYEYDPHERAAEAGYAAIYAHREHLSVVEETRETEVRRATVDSSLRFADVFPEHDNAPAVLGAAADDLYDMSDFQRALAAAQQLITTYPQADADLRRAGWTIVAHSSFDLALYAEAEQAYAQVLTFVPEGEEERQSLVDNLAASIYKQGELAGEGEDYRTAANHFLRIREAAPESSIRSSAEYDAAAALIRLEDWLMAGQVLEEFRQTFPEHELQREVTRQLASVYRQAGDLERSAEEYERVAAESEDSELRREALLLAGELYEDAAADERALAVYLRYVEQFPRPLDNAQETRFRVAGMYELRGDIVAYHDMLEAIVEVDAAAADARTDRSRVLAARSALVLTERYFAAFADIDLVQPFEESLVSKQNSMDAALGAFQALVDYQVGDVTAAATYYVAEIYYEFSRSLMASQRPADMPPDALLDYDLALEEEAFPFEEQAIDVHEQNFALIAQGVFNPWVRRSLEKLAAMMPGRYDKSEISSGFLGSIDFYAYRSPGAERMELAEGARDGLTDIEEPIAQIAE